MARGSIYVRKLKNGERRYEVRYAVNGKGVGKRFDSRGDAEDWLEARQSEVRGGTHRNITKATLTEYVEDWKTVHMLDSLYKPSTLAGYRFFLEKHILPQLGRRQLSDISAADLNRLMAKKMKEGQSQRAVVRMIHLLNKIFRHAVSDGYLRTSPVKDISKPVLTKKRSGRALKPDEIQAVLALLDEQTSLMVLVAILTGMRQGEEFGLFWEDIDWNEDVIRVRRELCWKFGKYHAKGKGEGSLSS